MAEVILNRRTFLISASAIAGGMSLSLTLPVVWAGAADAVQKAPETAAFSAWLTISADDTVTVYVPTGEFGTGSFTQIPMNVTEELGCDWSKVRGEFASARRDYLEGGPYAIGMQPFFTGHGTDHDRMHYALQLGASARERLRTAAAEYWQAPLTEIAARDSLLTHIPTGRQLRYGEMAATAATVQLTDEPALKPQSEWTFLGKASPGKLQLPGMVNGSAVYGIDVKVPGMVYAALRQCPVQGGTLKHHEPDAVLNMPGVRAVVVVDPSKTKGSPVKPQATFGLSETASQSGVAVIAEHYWQAKKALDALPMEWDYGPGVSWASQEDIYSAAFSLLENPPQKVLRKAGDIASATGALTVEANYLTPYCDQVAMEPLNGTALVTADKVEVWASCQDSQQAYWVAVDESGRVPENVYLHRTLVGGGFGRRSFSEEVRMVVAVAAELPDVPVQVIWSREEMMRQGRYRTLIASHFKAALDEQGMLQSWDAHATLAGNPMVSLPLGFFDTPYVVGGDIPNVQIGTTHQSTNILTGAYRGPCYNSYAFMVETFIDECAIAAGIDPLAYRLKLLANWDPAWSKCLQVAAQKADWGSPLPRGQGRGIAISNWPAAGQKEGGSTVCAVAKVEVSREGVLQVQSIDLSFDCGRIANRDAVLAQLEGGIVFGLNMSLNEEITISDGAVVEGNFDQYPVLRLADLPPRINI
ncbi:MAG: xanthine dehydrogenase family protein molybdopterin-binding subunit, partial [Halioglobus sp.]|nr:xanthine dehydrogenase family protein molybdopterin-binding subunit [Halioglobus sp.]